MVTMQTYQMAILLLFESTDCLQYKEIQDSLQLNKDMLQKHILSLVESKLLLSDTEVFLINYLIKKNCGLTFELFSGR